MFLEHQIKYSEYPPFLILGDGPGLGQKTKRTEKTNRGKIGFLNNSRNEIYFDIRFLCKELQPNFINNFTYDIRNIF
tara:strand:+ start:2199 stop:2429 length:231 start_codon:yes stop_codon:yes gene_type:complete